MKLQTLRVVSRQPGGKGGARRIRARGLVPGVVYGGDDGPRGLAVEASEFDRLLRRGKGEHPLVQLEIEGDGAAGGPALLKEIQHDPVRGHVIHADFQRIRLDERITTHVRIVLVGQAQGVTEGGVLDHQLREVEVECMALDIPEAIEVDISALNIGDGLHVKAITPPENVTILTSADRAIVAVHAPRVVAVEEPEPGEGAEEGEAEPAVVGEETESTEEAKED